MEVKYGLELCSIYKLDITHFINNICIFIQHSKGSHKLAAFKIAFSNLNLFFNVSERKKHSINFV